jgi:hypothetical protein
MLARIGGLVGSVATVALPGCSSSATGPEPEDVVIEVHVTGGFAGVDYAYAIVGASSDLRGISCESGCDFAPGDVLASVTPTQVTYYAGLLEDAGIHGLDGTDFGQQCCDQFHYEVTYGDGQRVSTVSGSAGALPADLARAVGETHRLFFGLLPILIEWESKPADWPQGGLSLPDHVLEGSVLTLDVAYGGGCTTHDFDLVAWGGWMESFPVRVNVLLSHDDRGDPCDGIVQRELRFDLTRLRDEYLRSYPTLGPGPSTLLLQLRVPDGKGAREIAYTF